MLCLFCPNFECQVTQELANIIKNFQKQIHEVPITKAKLEEIPSAMLQPKNKEFFKKPQNVEQTPQKPAPSNANKTNASNANKNTANNINKNSSNNTNKNNQNSNNLKKQASLRNFSASSNSLAKANSVR